jgi:hypothetical protein
MTHEDAADLVAAKLAELGIRAELVSASSGLIRFRVDRRQIEVPIGPDLWAALPGLPVFVDKIPVRYDQLLGNP